MCGIAGFTGSKNTTLLKKMTECIIHRGPDESGYYEDDGISLGHRRLSIIDLFHGRQPLFNEDRTKCLVLDGEIFNYIELREELSRKGHTFSTNTDTEVILHLYEDMGVDFVEKLNGMFAIALWDKTRRELILVRDRLGIKPLYYTLDGNDIYFASEVRSLLNRSGVKYKISPRAIDEYLTYRYVPFGLTMFEGIHKLNPSEMMVHRKGRVIKRRYWDINLHAEKKADPSELEEEFRWLFRDSVRLRLRMDVPYGMFISGGVDSTMILNSINEMNNRRLSTFTIGFNTDIDEFREARGVSRHYHTKHTELFVSPEDYSLIPEIVYHLDAPVGDAFIIPHYILSREASKGVKVVFTGDGADEIFSGYVHHKAIYYGNMIKGIIPGFLRRYILPGCLKTIPVRLLDKVFPYPAFLGKSGRAKLINYIKNLDSLEDSFLSLVSLFSEEEKKRLLAPEYLYLIVEERNKVKRGLKEEILSDDEGHDFNTVCYFDIRNWLPNQILFLLDKLHMASSLETRSPFLDHRLVEYSARLPSYYKIKGTRDKYILRRAAERDLRKDIIQKRKGPLFMPTDKVFKSDYRDFVHGTLNSDNIKRRGIFNYGYVEDLLKHIKSPDILYQKQILALLMLEIWFQVYSREKVSV